MTDIISGSHGASEKEKGNGAGLRVLVADVDRTRPNQTRQPWRSVDLDSFISVERLFWGVTVLRLLP